MDEIPKRLAIVCAAMGSHQLGVSDAYRSSTESIAVCGNVHL